MNLIGRYLNDFYTLFFPKLCYGCGTALLGTEKTICTSCSYTLPYTDFHLDKENAVAKQFWGRVNIETAVAYLFFAKKGKLQNLMHQLKYYGQKQIGIELGRSYGTVLKNHQYYQQVDAIIPVPLHIQKQKKRGYNQSEQFAIGLSESLGIPVKTDMLKRIKQSDSQTFMDRNKRHENMKTVFEARAVADIQNVLLVDDTITTGATLEACALALQKAGIKNIHIAGIAFTT